MQFDGNHRLAVFVASRSDIDDLIPILTAYQIEWNKLNVFLQNEIAKLFLAQYRDRRTPSRKRTQDAGRSPANGCQRFAPYRSRVGGALCQHTDGNVAARKQIGVRQIAGSLADYRRATSRWWDDLVDQLSDRVDLVDRPVYFVSSNTHSLANLLTGFALREEKKLLHFIEAHGHENLMAEYRAIQAEGGAGKPNFLYYVSKKYLNDEGDDPLASVAR